MRSTFSILTPVYNVEKFLPSCIESVLAQTFTDWELILVDDGSTDDSRRICDEYAAKYPLKIKAFHNENHGQLYSRNFAVSKATGFYYVFLDSDDKLLPHTLKTIYDKFQQYACDLVVYGVANVLPNGEVIHKTSDLEVYYKDKRLLYRKIFLNNSYNSLWRKAIKSSLITYQDYTAYYHIKRGEDLLQSLEILHNCRTAVIIPDILYHYTQNQASITHSTHTKPLKTSFVVREKVLDFLQQENVFTAKDMQEYHRYCIKLLEGELKLIALHSASYIEKKRLLNSLKQQSYYRNFLASRRYKQPFTPLYTQFRLGLYILLVWEIKSFDCVKKLLKSFL